MKRLVHTTYFGGLMPGVVIGLGIGGLILHHDVPTLVVAFAAVCFGCAWARAAWTDTRAALREAGVES